MTGAAQASRLKLIPAGLLITTVLTLQFLVATSAVAGDAVKSWALIYGGTTDTTLIGQVASRSDKMAFERQGGFMTNETADYVETFYPSVESYIYNSLTDAYHLTVTENSTGVRREGWVIDSFMVANGYDTEELFLHYRNQTTFQIKDDNGGPTITIVAPGVLNATTKADTIASRVRAFYNNRAFSNFQTVNSREAYKFAMFLDDINRAIVDGGQNYYDGIIFDNAGYPPSNFGTIIGGGGWVDECDCQISATINSDFAIWYTNNFESYVREFQAELEDPANSIDGRAKKTIINAARTSSGALPDPYGWSPMEDSEFGNGVVWEFEATLTFRTYGNAWGDTGPLRMAERAGRMATNGGFEFWIPDYRAATQISFVRPMITDVDVGMSAFANYLVVRGDSSFYQHGLERDLRSPTYMNTWPGMIDEANALLGEPVGGHYLFYSTTTAFGDDANVYARDYENGLALARHYHNPPYSPTYTWDDPGVMIYSVALPDTFQQIFTDGTRGPDVTELDIRNGEGFVLWRSSTPPQPQPPPIDPPDPSTLYTLHRSEPIAYDEYGPIAVKAGSTYAYCSHFHTFENMNAHNIQGQVWLPGTGWENLAQTSSAVSANTNYIAQVRPKDPLRHQCLGVEDVGYNWWIKPEWTGERYVRWWLQFSDGWFKQDTLLVSPGEPWSLAFRPEAVAGRMLPVTFFGAVPWARDVDVTLRLEQGATALGPVAYDRTRVMDGELMAGWNLTGQSGSFDLVVRHSPDFGTTWYESTRKDAVVVTDVPTKTWPMTMCFYLSNSHPDGGPFTSGMLDTLAWHDEVVLDRDNAYTNGDVAEAIHDRGTPVRVSAFWSSEGVNADACSGFHFCDVRDSVFVNNYLLYNVAGDTVSTWPGAYTVNVSTKGPAGTVNGIRYHEWFSRHVFEANQDPRTAKYGEVHWDGIFLDNLWNFAPYWADPTVDVDGDGEIDNQDDGNHWWNLGAQDIVSRMRDLFGNDFAVVTNGRDSAWTWTNGRYWEDASYDLPYNWTDIDTDPLDLFNVALNYDGTPRRVNVLQVSWPHGNRKEPDTTAVGHPAYAGATWSQHLRFSAATAMMADAHLAVMQSNSTATKWWPWIFDLDWPAPTGPRVKFNGSSGRELYRREWASINRIVVLNRHNVAEPAGDDYPAIAPYDAYFGPPLALGTPREKPPRRRRIDRQ